MPYIQQIDYEPILQLLRTGMNDTAVATRLGCSRPTVRKVRVRNNLPAVMRGSKPKHFSFEDAYRAHAKPGADGHMTWTGGYADVTPAVSHRHRTRSAYKIAFRLHHGRDPQGLVKPGCTQRGCVAGAHLTDAMMRRTARETAAAARPRKVAGPQPNGTRTEILALIGEGHSDTRVARILHTTVTRVAKIRAGEGLPAWKRSVPSVEEKWATWVRPMTDGHVRWAGPLHLGTPIIRHRGRNHSARAVGFTALHGRTPVGKVLPDCGMTWCVSPEHGADDVMRRADHLYDHIFGAAA